MRCDVCGCDSEKPDGQPRSVAQIRRYFAVIRAAHTHWPEIHRAQFASPEECRAWLQMRAGYREVGAQIPMAGMSKERAMLLAEAAIRGAGSYAMPVIHGDVLVIFKPKSIAFGKMSHVAFCALASAVELVIEQETGIRVDDLMLEVA